MVQVVGVWGWGEGTFNQLVKRLADPWLGFFLNF